MAFFGAFFAGFFAFFAIASFSFSCLLLGRGKRTSAILPSDTRIRVWRARVKKIQRKNGNGSSLRRFGGECAAVVALARQDFHVRTTHAHFDGVVVHLAVALRRVNQHVLIPRLLGNPGIEIRE